MVYPIYPKHITTNVGFHTESLLYVYFQRQHLWFAQTPKELLKIGTITFRPSQTEIKN